MENHIKYFKNSEKKLEFMELQDKIGLEFYLIIIKAN